MPTNKQIHLDSRPQGEAAAATSSWWSATHPRCKTARCWCATIT